MESRIEINGVWYVREDTINNPSDSLILAEETVALTFSEECCYETSKYCFVASRIKKDDSEEFYPDIDIKFTDKRSGDRDTWKEEYWDNNNWFKGILEGNPESVEALDKETELCEEGLRLFIGFLFRLVEEGWIN